jgi:hypothetical protein
MVEPALVASPHDDDGTAFGEFFGNRQTDPLRASGDDGGLSLK